MSYSDSEILCAYEKMQKIAKEYDFYIGMQNDSIVIGRSTWSSGITMKTAMEALKFLEGFEFGFRAGKKSNT